MAKRIMKFLGGPKDGLELAIMADPELPPCIEFATVGRGLSYKRLRYELLRFVANEGEDSHRFRREYYVLQGVDPNTLKQERNV